MLPYNDNDMHVPLWLLLSSKGHEGLDRQRLGSWTSSAHSAS
jgi:hypothetical protein